MLGYKDIPVLNEKYERRIQLQNDLEFQDMPVAKPPTIGLFDDNMSFYDPASVFIHIGTRTFIELFKVKDEEEYLMALIYMRGHESQHCHSTTDRPYSIGIQRGCEKVLEYISSKEEKTRRRFRKPADYVDFANVVLPSMGIYLSFSLLKNLIAAIANSVEDGRIERIRCIKYPGYAPLVRLFRGRFWQMPTEHLPYKDVAKDPGAKLKIIMNQILSLATCQLYEKGFVQAYAGTPIVKEIDKIMPFIARGVMAKSCRDMAEEVVNIAEALAPYIYDVIKLSADQIAAKKALEEMLADMIKKSVESSPMMNGFDRKESEEETDESGDVSSVFPNSDLCITLDDETYDKLMENSPKGNGQNGIMVKREHPKEEEEKKDDSSSEGQSDSENKSGNGSDKDGKGKGSRKDEQAESSKGSSSAGDDEADKKEKEGGNASGSKEDAEKSQDGNNASGSGSGEKSEEDAEANGYSASSGEESGSDKDEKGSGSDKGENGMNMDAAGNPGMALGSEGSDASGESSDGGNSDSSSNNSSSSSDSQESIQNAPGLSMNTKGESRKALRKDGEETLTGKNKSVEDAIIQAMKDAAETARVDVERQISSVNQANAKAKTTAKKREVLKPEPIDPSKFKDICSNFVEERRKYKLTVRTPAVMQARIDAFARKNRKYLKSLSTPNVSNLDSGSVDPSLAYGLAFGNTEIFRKQGKDKKFDGCVYLLIDNSGSMCGDKRTEACKAAAVVEGAFQGLMPMKIVAFDTQYSICHEVVKDWDEVTNNSCCWNFCVQGRDGGGNEDGYDIMIATREILARPERKKLIMVLSDGAPGNTNLVKKAVTDARKKGIEVFGIYFEEGEVSQYHKEIFEGMYQKDTVCCELSKVDENLSRLIKKFSRS